MLGKRQKLLIILVFERKILVEPDLQLYIFEIDF